MRKSTIGLLALLTLPLGITGCGDSTSSEEAKLTSSERQNLAQLGESVSSFKMIADGFTESAQSMATGFASSFAPTSGRAAVTSCNIDTSYALGTTTYSLKVTTADGAAISTCSDAQAAYSSASGIGIQMRMTTTEEGMSLDMNMKMVYRPVGTAGGYSAVMDLDMSVSSSEGGQQMSFGINPMHITVSASSEDAVPTMDGYMTFSFTPFTIVKLGFDENGLKAGSYDITKSGSKVAVMVVDASGTATVNDLSGTPIRG